MNGGDKLIHQLRNIMEMRRLMYAHMNWLLTEPSSKLGNICYGYVI